jgi:hypothetical protein
MNQRLYGLLIALYLFSSTSVSAAGLEARWLGVAGMSITDGETTLLFDPVFTKPSLRNWVSNAPFRSNEIKVKQGLQDSQITNANAIFASHCHFDHSIDVALIASKTGATIYGGPSLKAITTSDSTIPVSFSNIVDRDVISVGRFKIKVFRREHPPILQRFEWKFLPGLVSEMFHFNFYDYKEGEIWAFRIEHPEGNILIDQGSHFFPDLKIYSGKTDAYFVGVANKTSLPDLIENNIKAIGAPIVVPLHFDFFLLQSEILEGLNLPGNDLEAIQESMHQSVAPKMEFRIPKRNELIQISRTEPNTL